MTAILLYCIAVLTLLILYYLYKPNINSIESDNKIERKNSSHNTVSNSDNDEIDRLRYEPINANDLILLTKEKNLPVNLPSLSSEAVESTTPTPVLNRKRKCLSISESVPLETFYTSACSPVDLLKNDQSKFQSFFVNNTFTLNDTFFEKFKIIIKFYYYYHLHKYLILLCKYMGLQEPFENDNLNKYAKYRKNLSSRSSIKSNSSNLNSSSIIKNEDNYYKSIDEIINELNKLVLNGSFSIEDSISLNSHNTNTYSNKINIIIGVDLTASNEWKGRKTFNSQSLHKTLGDKLFNPYQKVLGSISFTLNKVLSNNILLNSFCSSFYCGSDTSSVNFNSNGQISSISLNNFYRVYAFGFGDSITKDKFVFSFSDLNLFTTSSLINLDLNSFDSFDDLLIRYNETVKRVSLSGPTSFAPIIYTAIDIIRYQQLLYKSSSSSLSSLLSSFYLLFIITDGKLNAESERETLKALQMASNYPLCVICVGVGDGPWHTMAKLEHNLSYYVNNKFDNLTFVDYHELVNKNIKNTSVDLAFALKALTKLPKQFKDMRSLNFI